MASPGIKLSQLQTKFGRLWNTLAPLFAPYRPERHYMRGPGPKWRAKYSPN